MVQFLVSQGADIETRCPAYKDATPVTVAAMYGHRLIVEFLLAASSLILVIDTLFATASIVLA